MEHKHNNRDSTGRLNPSEIYAARTFENISIHAARRNTYKRSYNKKRRKPKLDHTRKKIQTRLKKACEKVPSVDALSSPDQGSGDLPVNIEEDEIFRILSKNPRGFCFEQGEDDKITAGIEYFHDIQAGAVLVQETNTDWKIYKTRERLRNKLYKYWKHHSVTTSASEVKAKVSTYLPGGIATAILGRWSSRIMETGSDKKQGVVVVGEATE